MTGPTPHGRTYAEWRTYVSSAKTRGEAGERVLEAYGAGFNRATLAYWLGCSVGYVSRLAGIARAGKDYL